MENLSHLRVSFLFVFGHPLESQSEVDGKFTSIHCTCTHFMGNEKLLMHGAVTEFDVDCLMNLSISSYDHALSNC